MKLLSERLHDESGYVIKEFENDDGTTTEIIETNDGEELDFKLFMQTFSRHV